MEIKQDFPLKKGKFDSWMDAAAASRQNAFQGSNNRATEEDGRNKKQPGRRGG